MTATEIFEKLVVGARVRYKGDVCNHPGKGSIAEIKTSVWGTDVRVILEAEGNHPNPEYNLEQREFWVTANAFLPGVGTRFFLD